MVSESGKRIVDSIKTLVEEGVLPPRVLRHDVSVMTSVAQKAFLNPNRIVGQKLRGFREDYQSEGIDQTELTRLVNSILLDWGAVEMPKNAICKIESEVGHVRELKFLEGLAICTVLGINPLDLTP